MEQVLLVVQVIIAVGLIGLVLIQRSDSDGFGLSGGSGNNLLSGRAGASALTRITAFFAAAFIVNSLALGILAAHGSGGSIAEKIEQQQAEQAPAVPAVPLAGAEKVEKKSADESTNEKAAEKTEEAPAVPTEGAVKKPKKKEAEFDPNTAE